MVPFLFFFWFDEKFYKQIFNCPMRSPLGLIIAELSLTQQENDGVPSIDCALPLYCRYVDGM